MLEKAFPSKSLENFGLPAGGYLVMISTRLLGIYCTAYLFIYLFIYLFSYFLVYYLFYYYYFLIFILLCF